MRGEVPITERVGSWGAVPMSVIEVVSGDFQRGPARIRYSDAGRAFLRLMSSDGRQDDVWLATDVAAAAEAGEGNIDEYLKRLAARDGFTYLPSSRAADAAARRVERLFVVLLRDGRKFVARGAAETVDEIRTAALPPERRREELARLEASRLAAATPAGFIPNIFARLLPHR